MCSSSIRRYEKTQTGNPHKLTINQHIFPRASMNRFADDRQFVQVRRFDHSDQIGFRTDNSYFCARRVWDQKTEAGLMLNIENKFQDIAEQVVSGSLSNLTQEMHERITDLYILWHLRFSRYLNPIQDRVANGLSPEELTKDTQEILESNGYAFLRPDGTFPGRFLAGIGFIFAIGHERQQMKGTNWGIIHCESGEFVVPDNFRDFSIVPLAPKICLIAGMKNTKIKLEQVAEINARAVQSSQRYLFARDLDVCPIVRPITLALRQIRYKRT